MHYLTFWTWITIPEHYFLQESESPRLDKQRQIIFFDFINVLLPLGWITLFIRRFLE